MAHERLRDMKLRWVITHLEILRSANAKGHLTPALIDATIEKCIHSLKEIQDLLTSDTKK